MNLGIRASWALLAIVSVANAQSKVPNRTLSLDSGYVNSLYSNRAFWNFGIELDYAGSALFDWANSSFFGSSGLTRILLGTGTYFAWRYAEYSFFVSNHEFGHGTRIVAGNGTPSFAWNGAGASSSIFSFYVSGLTQYNNGAATSTPGLYIAPTDWTYAIAAGGVNNSTAYAEAIEDEVTMQGGHVLQYIGYVRGKTDASRYVQITQGGSAPSGGDMQVMKDFYAAKGYGISYNDIKTGSEVSRWLSSTQWSFLWSAFRYVYSGDSSVSSPMLGVFKLPDVSHYLNRKGLSYKIRTGLRGANYWFPISVEYLYKGDTAIEVGVGYAKLFTLASRRQGRFGVDFYANSNASLGTVFHADFPLSMSFTASAGASFFQTNSLMGERQIANLTGSGVGGYEAWVRLSRMYD